MKRRNAFSFSHPCLSVTISGLILLWTIPLQAEPWPKPAKVESPRGMVVCVSPAAADVGAAVLRRGGNAVDAAVATALAMAVTFPEAGNIGGGGFMLVWPGEGRGEPTCIEYRETAPAACRADT